jgi:hypothetical protein
MGLRSPRWHSTYAAPDTQSLCLATGGDLDRLPLPFQPLRMGRGRRGANMPTMGRPHML